MVRNRRKTRPPEYADRTTSYIWDVFLSHTSADKSGARRLVRRLKEQGLNVWFDEEQIGPGDAVVQRLNHGLSNSRRLVFLLTVSSTDSRFCEAEVYSLLASQIISAATRVVIAHYGELADVEVPLLLRDLQRVDVRSKEGALRLAERLRQPISAEEYCANLKTLPLLPSGFGDGPYHVEPPEFLPVMLGEVAFQYGGPLRAIRTSDPAVSLSDFASLLTSGRSGRLIVLFGEAGIGKSTLCRLLSRRLADEEYGNSFLPVYIPLGEWDSKSLPFDRLIDRELGFDTIHALLSRASFKRRLVLFLDGLNEQAPESLTPVFSFARRVVVSHRAIVVLTTRLVAAANRILSVEDLRFFEVRRWTPQQLESYFARNHRAELLRRVPPEVRNSLRLPLLASLVLRRMLQEDHPPHLQAVPDVFEYILGQFARDMSGRSKARGIKGAEKLGDGLVRDCLRELALRMTQQRVVQTDGAALEDCLPGRSKKSFRAVAAVAVNGGLLRCSDSVAAVDPESSTAELRKLKIGFLHQAVQEYLAAQRLENSRSPVLPANISHDAFWRDIPLYLTRCLSDRADRQKRFVLSFLRTEHPDFLTASRLVHEVADSAVRAQVQHRVIAGLLESMDAAFYYPYSIEAFHELGAPGIATLRSCLSDIAALRRVYAGAESHIIGCRPEEAEETHWRRAARSIYMLGELGDMDSMAGLAEHIPSIRSRHLLYHIGEALLTLCRRYEPGKAVGQRFLKISGMLRQLPNADPVIRAQALSVSKTLGSRHHLKNVTGDLVAFLYASSQDRNPHFRQEYWCRAHGVEALAEIGRAEDCVRIFSSMHATEDRADYGDHADGHYRQVQSSILKAVARCCDAQPGCRHVWQPLLEAMFQSARVAENGWACRHLESLLLKSFSESDDLAWIRAWKDSGALGGPLVERILANVLWLTS